MNVSSPADSGEHDRARRLRRRNRRLVGGGLVCFLVGVPLVSLPDGTALSLIGLCLVAGAGACLISLVLLVAGEGAESDADHEREE